MTLFPFEFDIIGAESGGAWFFNVSNLCCLEADCPRAGSPKPNEGASHVAVSEWKVGAALHNLF